MGTTQHFDGDDEYQQLELGRNDGEDMKNTNKIIRDMNEGQFEWSISNKKAVPSKLQNILEQSEPRSQPKTQPKKLPKEFLKEREEEDDDDEEFEPIDEEGGEGQEFEEEES
jgi:hypothetical protein